MKKKLILSLAFFYCGILFAQTKYDPLTDPNVQKPENPGLFLERMKSMRQLEILQAVEYKRADFQAFYDDYTKTNLWRSTLQKVVVRNTIGNDLEKDKEYEEAIKVYYWVVWNKKDYNQYHTEDPMVGFYYFKTCFDMGRLFTKMGNYKNSFEFYNAAIDFYKTDSSLYFATLAGMNGIKDKTISAAAESSTLLKNINRAIELKPNSGAYRSTRGTYYLEIAKDSAKAFADFLKATQLNPSDDKSYFNLAKINWQKDQYPDAIKNLSACISIDPMQEVYYAARAVIYKIQKNYTAAISDFSNAISINAINASYYKGRADCYIQSNNAAAAYDDYGFSIMLNPNDNAAKELVKKIDPFLKDEYEKMGFTPQNAYPFFLKMADNFLSNKQYGPAIMNYQKCIQAQPKNPVPYNKAGLIFNSLHLNVTAKQYLRYAAYSDGRNPVYFIDLGNAYFDEKEFKTASGCYDTAALLGSTDAFTFNNNGLIKEYQLENYEGAIKDYTRAIKIDSNHLHPAYLVNRGRCYQQIKNYTAALADFELLIKLKPEDKEYKKMLLLTKEKLKE